MSPELRSWMRPEDLVLFQLELLPWAAFTHLVESYFISTGHRVRMVDSTSEQTDFLLFSLAGCRQLLRCCSARSAGQVQSLEMLRRSMNKFQVDTALLVTPADFAPSLAVAALNLSIDLYSGNRLRAKIELLPTEQRRQVLDSIRAQPEPSIT